MLKYKAQVIQMRLKLEEADFLGTVFKMKYQNKWLQS